MAVFDINKITLPDGDICEVRDQSRLPESEYNYIINSLPYFKGDEMSSNGWSFVILPSNSVTTCKICDAEISAQISATCTSLVMRKSDYELTGPYYQIDLSDFHDGDYAMISFEYKSDANIGAVGRCSTFSNPQQISYSYTGDAIPLSATSNWKRVWFKGQIPSGWDTKYAAKISSSMELVFTPQGATNLKIRRISLTKSPTRAQWLPNPQDVIGDFNHYNYIPNGFPNRWLSWKMGTIAVSSTTGCSTSFNAGVAKAICSTYDSTSSPYSTFNFYYQYTEHMDEGQICNLIWSGWKEGDPFTCSVEVKSNADFYITAYPRTKFLSEQDWIQPWETGTHKVLVRGNDKWNRIWISGIIPDGFMETAQDYDSYASAVTFFIYYTGQQTVLLRKFAFTKGLQRTDWIPGMMDSPGRIMYYDETAGTNYTIGSSNYTQLTRPTVIPVSVVELVNVSPLSWSTNSGAFSIQTYPLQSYSLLVGQSGTTVNNLKLRWYYTFNDKSGFEVSY